MKKWILIVETETDETFLYIQPWTPHWTPTPLPNTYCFMSSPLQRTAVWLEVFRLVSLMRPEEVNERALQPFIPITTLGPAGAAPGKSLK